MKYFSLYFSVLLLLFSCSGKKEVEIIELETLRESQLYALYDVLAYMEKHTTENEKIATQYEEKYETALKENPQKALYYLKRAISLEPTLERYKKLGTFLIDLKKYKEALDLYELIAFAQYRPDSTSSSTVHLFAPPDDGILYERLVAQLLYDFQPYSVREVMADEDWKNRLMNDKRLGNDTSSSVYKKLMYVLNNEESKQLVFSDVFQYIKDTSSVFEINAKTVNAFQYPSDDLDYEFKAEHEYFDYNSFLFEGKENYFGSFNFTHLVKISPAVLAIVYRVDTSATACPKDMRHIYHRLVTYTPKGEIIDTKVVAWQAAEQLATMNFANGMFTISEQKRTWKNAYEKWDFDNFILKTESIGSKTYQILHDGKIEEGSTL